MMAEMPSEKRNIMKKEEYFFNRHAVLGCIVGLLLVAVILVTGIVLIMAYACIVTVPAFLLATKVTTNKILFAFIFAPLFVMMFIITAPISFFIKDSFEKLFKNILTRMYGPSEDDKDEIW